MDSRYLPVTLLKTPVDRALVLKIVFIALLAADCGDMTLLGLLDLSAAFAMVHHNILTNRLHTDFRSHRSVLSLIQSFIRMRMQTVIFSGV